MSDHREELFTKLPNELQCYGVSLLWTLVALSGASPRVEKLLLTTMPPGSVDALQATEAITAERKLTDRGRKLAALAADYRDLIDEIDPSVDFAPIEAVRLVEASLSDHPSDMIRYRTSSQAEAITYRN